MSADCDRQDAQHASNGASSAMRNGPNVATYALAQSGEQLANQK